MSDDLFAASNALKRGGQRPADIIDGVAGEVIPPERAIVPVQPGQALVASDGAEGQERMLSAATRIATSLTQMVEAQKLYTTIRGKKYPHVEAWMTIGRMDNVVAREAERPSKNEDGSWEAFVELVRLSDGMVIGRASAMAGAKGDGDWTGRPDHVKRSMAVTRATSRAFRQQYSWIMTLAGYQPTPADEMPQEERDTSADNVAPKGGEREELVGKVKRRGMIRKGTSAAYDMEVRQTPDGMAVGFKLEVDSHKAIPQVLLSGAIGASLVAAYPDPKVLIGTAATVSGLLYNVRVGQKSWYRLHVDRFENDDWILPADKAEPTEAMPEPLFSAEEQAKLDAAIDATAS